MMQNHLNIFAIRWFITITGWIFVSVFTSSQPSEAKAQECSLIEKKSVKVRLGYPRDIKKICSNCVKNLLRWEIHVSPFGSILLRILQK